MDENGWYITQAVAPEGTYKAGEECWVVMCNGEWVQGFPLTIAGTEDAFTWGLWNGKGILEWRR